MNNYYTSIALGLCEWECVVCTCSSIVSRPGVGGHRRVYGQLVCVAYILISDEEEQLAVAWVAAQSLVLWRSSQRRRKTTTTSPSIGLADLK